MLKIVDAKDAQRLFDLGMPAPTSSRWARRPAGCWIDTVIVRLVDDGVYLITQPDHARLAGTIMQQCVPLASRPRRDAILHATAEHDGGWIEEDAAPTIDPTTGDVVDFVNAPLGVRHTVWQRGISRLTGDPWAAALVAQHAVTVYDRFRPDPEWASFFARMEAVRDAMVRASGIPFDDLAADYAFVRLGDLISLSFCTAWTDEQRFDEWTVRCSGPRLVITPDAFGGGEIPIQIAGKVIPVQRFQSDAELREAVRHARTATLRGTVGGQRGASGRDPTART